MNYNVVKEIVAAVDGVDVYVEKNMHYNDNAGDLHINLKKGENTLTPETAEEFLRFRHDALGDIGRIERQQVFVRANEKIPKSNNYPQNPRTS